MNINNDEDEPGPANIQINDGHVENGQQLGHAHAKNAADRPEEHGQPIGKKAVYIQLKKNT